MYKIYFLFFVLVLVSCSDEVQPKPKAYLKLSYAKKTYKAEPLITSLKKLSKNSLSNLTPHPAYVFMHYSHPTLLERIKNLKA